MWQDVLELWANDLVSGVTRFWLEVCPNATLPSSLTFSHLKIKTLEWYSDWKLNLPVGFSMWVRELIWPPCVFMGDEHPVSRGDVSICLKTPSHANQIDALCGWEKLLICTGQFKMSKRGCLSWNESFSSSEFLSNYRDEQLKIIFQLSSDTISSWMSFLVLRCIKMLATWQFTAILRQLDW